MPDMMALVVVVVVFSKRDVEVYFMKGGDIGYGLEGDDKWIRS
jgi:hypothetical protein